MADEVDPGSGSEIGSTVVGARVVGAEWICTGSRSSPTPSALMTHVMDPTVKIWPGYGRNEDPAEKAILFDKETARTPLPSTHTPTRVVWVMTKIVDISNYSYLGA